ncbi:hypothetical protein EDD70_1080 [Hydrogenoanaerobacterium saccharovorans]|uniref:Uncharacterized protein n=1 Tax=Hydrogenoanaerobacterium saccharovorans TaxID=474960 RepID=A0A1H7ZZV0_9FIRM|nr:hypothetical protein [Hydrogenoanaerobacterium saccharovorans]RPF48265.1 hypothetical protein EDD70_1080 [Hydrogenoanaerobacterium saccharovorans]SEM63803.1 hypothetical protein SAMN05216180_1011 [Hydrogenoanaerobacterium saccharovorans]
MGVSEEITALKNIVRVGTVSSVNAANRTARVNFADKNNLVSGPLKILKNPPFVTADAVELTYGVEVAEGHTHAGKAEKHAHQIKIFPWVPLVGDLVLCIYLPNGESDGFVIGGI